jgi:phosphate-selective porin OprO and OprP
VFKKTHLKSLLGSILIGSITIISTPVMATNEAMLDLLKILKDKGSISAEEYDLLQNAAKADGEKVEGSINEMKADVDKKTKDLPKITTKGKIKIESPDGSWSFQPIGRIMWDTILSDRDGATSLAETNSELRRARMGFQGSIKPIKYKLELDFATSGTPSWKDVWLSYNGKNNYGKWFVKAGQHHVPFGQATISSSKYMPLMRRPLFADGPQHSRKVGIAIRQDNKRWFAHAGAFLPGLSSGSDETGETGTDRETYAFRIGGTPLFQDKKHLIHAGFSYQFEQINGDSFNNIDNSLVSHVGDSDSLNFDLSKIGLEVDEVNAFDFELISVWGPFHGIFEYVAWKADTKTSGSYDANAYAIDAGWFLTGESMKYKKGQFSGIKPRKAVNNGGWGAWQVAARFENMDLNDRTYFGGEADLLTVGLNWHPTSNTRMMANYVTTLDYKCPTTGLGCKANGITDVEPSAFQLRAQVYW